MGTFRWPLRISSMDGQRTQDLEATVDTGAAYTTLPGILLRELGIEPVGKRRSLLANGRRIEMDYGEARAGGRRERGDPGSLRRRRRSGSPGSLHPGGIGAGRGPGGAATGPHSSHHVLNQSQGEIRR